MGALKELLREIAEVNYAADVPPRFHPQPNHETPPNLVDATDENIG
ncbi:MAG: hypothetical protein JRN54_01305 [Nitrososphaerota archaeon]|nr:hypothetical protein [Nitrososphaerota archaeon]